PFSILLMSVLPSVSVPCVSVGQASGPQRLGPTNPRPPARISLGFDVLERDQRQAPREHAVYFRTAMGDTMADDSMLMCAMESGRLPAANGGRQHRPSRVHLRAPATRRAGPVWWRIGQSGAVQMVIAGP